MYSELELIPLEVFYSTFDSQGWLGWMYTKLISQPIKWTFQSLTGSETVDTGSGKWVKMDKLKEASTRVVQLHEKVALHGISDNLYTLTTFRAEFASKVIPGSILTDTDTRVLIAYLEHDRKVIMTKNLGDGSLHKYDSDPDDLAIKFCLKKDKLLKLEFTELDCNIVTIKKTSQKLHEQIQDIETRIKESKATASKYISLKQKTLAMKHLRKKLQLDKVLVKRINSLETIETILLKIQEAVSDTEILEVYKTGTNALQNTLVTSGLTIDKIDETMDHLQEVLVDQKEIEDAMKLGQDSMIDVTLGNIDDELEKELESLLISEKEKVSVKVKENITRNTIEVVEVTEEAKQPVKEVLSIKENNQELETLETKFYDLEIETPPIPNKDLDSIESSSSSSSSIKNKQLVMLD